MLGESLAIIALIAVLAAMLARRKRQGLAILILPMMAVPFFHVMGIVVGAAPYLFYVDLAALVLGLAACVGLSMGFVSGKGRCGYLALCVIFQGGLLLAYCMDYFWLL